MKFFILLYIFVIVHGQLSIDELFYFNSKHALTGDCKDFQYTFSNFQINSKQYNQFILNCNESSLIFQDKDFFPSSLCPKDVDYSQNFIIRFSGVLSEISIQANQLHLRGIELCSVDDIIRNTFVEYSYYRSQWALLINLENYISKEKYHLAISKNGEMTFIVLISSIKSNPTANENAIEFIFPDENIFRFNQSSSHVWRIDEGYVRTSAFLRNRTDYQLSKTKFTLFNNETFLLYGTQISYPRRFVVSVDETPVSCTYDHILQCRFPILPLNTSDTHQPMLRIIYDKKYILNTSLTLNPRTRLQKVPTQHSITTITTFEVNINENICINNSLKSSFSFIVHLWKEDVNSTVRYQKIVKNNIGPMDCNQTVSIGQYIKNEMGPISVDDIISMYVDLIHQWYDDPSCRTEQTRIQFN